LTASGLSGILGSGVGIVVNGGVVGSTRGEKRVVDIRGGLFGKSGQDHGVERVVGVIFGFGNEAADIGHLRVVENGDRAADIAG